MRFKGIVFLFLTVGLLAQEVDQQELSTVTVTDTINFINYTGVGTIDTIAAIRNIGEQLAVEAAPGESVVHAGKYRVTHVLPDDNILFGADILELLPTARVDHIDNLRRIISAYLEERYNYSSDDARLIGTLATIYNAVYRNNLDFFNTRYVPAVYTLLTEDSVGLSLTYLEWPGKSQIIIPITPNLGDLSSVPAAELLDESVEETLRDSSDLGLEERVDAADLIDRIVDSERSQIAEEVERIADRQSELSAEEDAVQSNLSELESQLAEADGLDASALEVEIALQQARQDEIEQEQLALADQEAANQQREAAADSADERSAEIRGSVAADLGTAAVKSTVSPLLITRSRLSDEGRLIGTILRINDDDVLQTAGQEIISRNYLTTRNGFVAISEDEGAARLVLFNSSDLSVELVGSTEVSPYSPLVSGPDGDLYAIIKEGNQWHAGHFDARLNLLFRSSIRLAEESDLVIDGSKLYVQRQDGRFSALDLDELKVSTE